MNNFRRTRLIAIFFLFTLNAMSQEFQVPQNYRLEKKEDYKPYEQDVLACIEYLENSPLNQNIEKRKEVNVFLLKWITGCPYIKIQLHSFVLDYTEKNKSFLLTFLNGWTRHAIQNPEEIDEFQGNLEGLKSIITVYNLGKGAVKDKKVQKLVKMESEGKLEKWLKKKLKEAQKDKNKKRK